MLGRGLRLVVELRVVERGRAMRTNSAPDERGLRRCPSVPHRGWPSARGAANPPAPPDAPDPGDGCEGA